MISVNPSGRHIGADIAGVDLSQPLDGETFAAVAWAFFEHEVVFFRKQTIAPAQHIEFTRRFGALEQHVLCARIP